MRALLHTSGPRTSTFSSTTKSNQRLALEFRASTNGMGRTALWFCATQPIVDGGDTRTSGCLGGEPSHAANAVGKARSGSALQAATLRTWRFPGLQDFDNWSAVHDLGRPSTNGVGKVRRQRPRRSVTLV
jgi:hypothetical protein